MNTRAHGKTRGQSGDWTWQDWTGQESSDALFVARLRIHVIPATKCRGRSSNRSSVPQKLALGLVLAVCVALLLGLTGGLVWTMGCIGQRLTQRFQDIDRQGYAASLEH
jgi:hypothetical protein